MVLLGFSQVIRPNLPTYDLRLNWTAVITRDMIVSSQPVYLIQ